MQKKWILNQNQSMTLMIQAVLDKIRKELDRRYWNKHQQEYNSPFDNTGNSYSNKYFTVRAYSWNDEEEQLPNFECELLHVYWYKHSNRGITYAFPENQESYDTLAKVLTNSLKSLEKDPNLQI